MKLKENTKLNRTLLAILVGGQFTFTAFADDGATTNSGVAKPVEVPAYSADAAAASSAEAAEITALKKSIEALEQKVNALEQQHNAQQSSSADVQALDQKVRIVERQRELDQEAAAAAAKSAPKLSVGPGGLTASSADTNFVFSLKGVLQVDTRTLFNDSEIKNNDGFLLRRARPIFQGTLYRDFDFVFVPDFGGSSVQIFDAYANYRYTPWLQVRAGKFKTPVGLEQLQQDVNIPFNERSLVTDLVPNRDVGFMLWGDISGGVLSYAAGVFNGVGDARNSSNSDFENHPEFAGRLFAQPFKNTDIAALQNLGFGVGGSLGNVYTNATGLPATTGGTLGGFTTDGQQQFFAYNPAAGTVVASGDHWRLSPQGYYYYGPFNLLGEYAISDQNVRNGAASADLKNTAWEISGGWVLTGEPASFTGIAPRHPFDPHNGSWGAFQVVARYADLDIDNAAFPLFANPATSASEAKAWSAGLNWYLNKNIRVNVSYSHTTFTGGGGAGATVPAIVTRQPEDAVFTRVQLGF